MTNTVIPLVLRDPLTRSATAALAGWQRVLNCELMPMNAVRPLCPPSAPHVLRVSDWFKVIDIDAPSVTAEVVERKPSGDFAALHDPCNTMGVMHRSAKAKRTVAQRMPRTDPLNTSTRVRSAELWEALFRGRRGWHISPQFTPTKVQIGGPQ